RSGVEADLAGSVGGGETVLEGGSAVVGASRGPRSVQLAGSHGKLVRLARFGRGGGDASILAGPGGRVRAVVPAADYRITGEVDVMAGDEGPFAQHVHRLLDHLGDYTFDRGPVMTGRADHVDRQAGRGVDRSERRGKAGIVAEDLGLRRVGLEGDGQRV